MTLLISLATLGFAPMFPAAASGVSWSQPVTVPLARCGASAPRVVFPSADPHTGSGPGAILWSGDPAACVRGGGSPGSGVGLAPIGGDDAAGSAQSLRGATGSVAVSGGLAAAAASGDGRIVIAAPFGPGAVGVFEGRAGGRFARVGLLRTGVGTVATATGYLGDVALASVSSGRVELRVRRHAVRRFSAPVLVRAGGGAVSSLAVGLDYRGDALVVWAQRGWIYRRVLSAAGALDGVERVAASPPAPQLQALISDDHRGIVAWTSDVPAGDGSVTRVYLDASRPGVHFGAPRLLERYRNPLGMRVGDGSLRLVRLSSEGVMMAWTGMRRGRYVVRAASVSLTALRPASVISGPGGNAVLDDLATGPHNEALAVWSDAPRLAGGGVDPSHEQLGAARGVSENSGTVAFSPPEAIGGPDAIVAARAAFDPASDNAVLAWQIRDQGIAYATRRPG